MQRDSTHNHLVCKRKLNHLAKLVSDMIRTCSQDQDSLDCQEKPYVMKFQIIVNRKIANVS